MAKWIDFQPRQDAKWSHVEYFVEKYKRILQYDDYKMEKLFEKFNDFKSFSDSELSAAVWEVAIVENMMMVEKNIESVLCGTTFNN